jgi:hypothetical protein
MNAATAKRQGLEVVYPKGHNLHETVFYDSQAGQYYDSSTDLYLWGYDPVTQKTHTPEQYWAEVTMLFSLMNLKGA